MPPPRPCPRWGCRGGRSYSSRSSRRRMSPLRRVRLGQHGYLGPAGGALLPGALADLRQQRPGAPAALEPCWGHRQWPLLVYLRGRPKCSLGRAVPFGSDHWCLFGAGACFCGVRTSGGGSLCEFRTGSAMPSKKADVCVRLRGPHAGKERSTHAHPGMHMQQCSAVLTAMPSTALLRGHCALIGRVLAATTSGFNTTYMGTSSLSYRSLLRAGTQSARSVRFG